MENEDSYILISLLLISKGSPLNNSFKLMQFIEWRLKIIDSKYILDKIKRESYVNCMVLNGVEFFSLTKIGEDFISQKYDNAKNFLFKNYPNEQEILTVLFIKDNSK